MKVSRCFILAVSLLAALALGGCSKESKEAKVSKESTGSKESKGAKGSTDAKISKDSKDIDIVKKGHLEFEKAKSIGDALDGYRFFAAKEWFATTSDKGARLVVFKADLSPQYVQEVNAACKSDPHFKKIDSQKWAIQFTVNKDDTVHISGTQSLSVLPEKKARGGSLNEGVMRSVFKNELAAVCR